MHNLVTGLMGATFIAVAILASTVMPEDHASEWEQSAALKALQTAEAGTTRRQAAAQALCNEARGPNSEARWMDDGSMVCTTRRSEKPMLLAGSAK